MSYLNESSYNKPVQTKASWNYQSQTVVMKRQQKPNLPYSKCMQPDFGELALASAADEVVRSRETII